MRRFACRPVTALLLATASLTSTAQEADVGLSMQNFGGGLLGSNSPTTIYPASFITMNPAQPRAEAIAVRGDTLLAIGSLDEVRAAAGDGAMVDDSLAGKTVLPGFVEQHVHPLLAALTMGSHVISIEDWDTSNGFSPAVRDPAGYAQRLRESFEKFDATADPGETFFSWGFHHYMHGHEMSRKMLDGLSATRPIVIWHRSCHEFYLNSAALARAGIDADSIAAMPESAQAAMELDQGHFFEQGAAAVLDKIAPLVLDPEQFVAGLQYTEEYYHRNGITIANEPGGFISKQVQNTVNQVYGDADTPFRHYFIPDGKSLALLHPDNAEELVGATRELLDWGSGMTAYLPQQVKLFSDGAIYSQLQQMADGYLDGHEGEWLMDPPLFNFAFQTYWDAGYQIVTHNNGDKGFDMLLGELEKAMARAPRKDHRTTVIHFGFAREEQVARWIELGGLVSSNPYYVTALAGRYGKMGGMDPKWAQNMVPHGWVTAHDGHLSFHSDMPMAPAKPLQLVWSAVNRMTYEGEVAGPEHRVSIDRALRSITIDAAHSLQMENRVGSLEVGKNANLTVLESDPYKTEPMDLKSIGVWGTMLEGRLQPVPTANAGNGPDTLWVANLAAGLEKDALTEATIDRMGLIWSHGH